MASANQNPFPDLTPAEDIRQKICLVQRAYRANFPFGVPETILRRLDTLRFVQIQGAFFDDAPDGKKRSISLDCGCLSALYSAETPFVFIVESAGWEKRILAGAPPQALPVLTGILASVAGPESVGRNPVSPRSPDGWQAGLVTGIPAPEKEGKSISKLYRPKAADMLANTLECADWQFWTIARPLNRARASVYQEAVGNEIQEIKATNPSHSPRAGRMASHYMQLLEKTFSRLHTGLRCGMWEAGLYFFSPNRTAEGLALLLSALSGATAQPEPMLSHRCAQNGQSYTCPCVLTSPELLSCLKFPDKEYQGFRLKERVDFDVDFRSLDGPSLEIGRIVAGGRSTDGVAGIAPKDLTRHAFVAGATGSGKTNTMFNLLASLWKAFRVPFLVIEPAKSEYRDLLCGIPELRIFTLGDETPGKSSPFRINPFFFPDGASLQTHIDYLKATFNAGFPMYGPMPYILEECLYEIYEDKGWDLASSENARGVCSSAFPTMTDLYGKIDPVVKRIGYDSKLESDIKSALKTRINNLRVGAKGKMLDTERGIDMEDLLRRPAVLELKYLGNDDEKAFVMGLVLAALYEHYESRDAAGGDFDIGGLRHATLIEEAHRLLKNVSAEKASEDSGNMKGKAVETFCNLLAEIRAYGEGILVSEQIPSKISPDIVKNTNLKLLHRMVSQEEREVMGKTMNLSDSQIRHAATMAVGEAVFFAEGLDRPMLVRVPESSVSTGGRQIGPSRLHRHMKENYFSERPRMLLRFPLCLSCPLRETSACERTARQVSAVLYQENGEALRTFAAAMATGFSENEDPFSPFAGGPDPAAAGRCLEAHATQHYLRQAGRFHHWPHKLAEQIAQNVAKHGEPAGRMALFSKAIRKADAKSPPPFRLCPAICDSVCLYGFQAQIVGESDFIHNTILDLLDAADSKQDPPIVAIREKLRDLIRWRLRKEIDPRLADRIADCLVVSKLDEIGATEEQQRFVFGV